MPKPNQITFGEEVGTKPEDHKTPVLQLASCSYNPFFSFVCPIILPITKLRKMQSKEMNITEQLKSLVIFPIDKRLLRTSNMDFRDKVGLILIVC